MNFKLVFYVGVLLQISTGYVFADDRVKFFNRTSKPIYIQYTLDHFFAPGVPNTREIPRPRHSPSINPGNEYPVDVQINRQLQKVGVSWDEAGPYIDLPRIKNKESATYEIIQTEDTLVAYEIAM